MKDMTMHELEKTNAGIGFFAIFLGGLGTAAGAKIIEDWDDFTDGLAGKPNPRRP